MAKLVLDEPETKPKLVPDEQPDFGMIALPKDKLPGVWDYNKQLDSLLGDPEQSIESFMPLDVRYDFGRIIGMTEKPDETKGKMQMGTFYNIAIPFAEPLPLGNPTILDALNKQTFGQEITSAGAFKKLQDQYQGYLKELTEKGELNLPKNLVPGSIPFAMSKHLASVASEAIEDIGIPEILKGIRESMFPTTQYGTDEWKQQLKETPEKLAWMAAYVGTLGGRVRAPNVPMPKDMREILLKRAEDYASFAPAIVPAGGDLTVLALEWGLVYPKLFQAVGLGGKIISGLPKVVKGTDLLKKVGGLSSIAKKYPRVYARVANILKAFSKGAGVGSFTAAYEGISQDMEPDDILQHAKSRAILMGGVASAFQVASEVDTAMYVKRLRNVLINTSGSRFDAKLREIDLIPIGVAKSAAYKSMASLKKAELAAIDKIVSATEANLLKIKQGKLYQTGQEAVENPQRAAERMIRYGLEKSRIPKGMEALEKGLGATKPFIEMPMTRVSEAIETAKSIAKAVRHPVKAMAQAQIPAKAPTQPSAAPTPPPVGKAAVSPEEAEQAQFEAEIAELDKELIETQKPATVPATVPEPTPAGRKAEIAPVTQPEAVEGEFVVKPPKKLYRGISKTGAGTFTLGKGLYSTPRKGFLKGFEFDEIVELTPQQAYPRNPLVLRSTDDFTDWLLRESGEKNIREFNKKWKDPGEFVRSKGFDGVVAGDEVVKYAQPPAAAKPEAMTAEEFSQFEIPLVKDEGKFPQITRIKNILAKEGIEIEEIGVTGSHAMGVATPESDVDIYVKVSDADYHKADDLLAPLSKEKIDAMVNWRGIGKEGGILRGQKTYKRLVEKAKPEAAKAKTLQEISDAELLEKRKPLTAIDKKRRKPQQIKELQMIEDELVGRHQAGKSDISEKTRSNQVKETAETIKDHDLYRDAEQVLDERYQALPLKTYSIARNKADIPGEIRDYIGKPGTKGYKGYLWKYLTTIEENPSATGYDEALDIIGGRPGDVGEFIARLDEVVQQQKGVEGIVNQTALNEAVATGEPYIELLAMKYEMLKEGFDAQEINDTIKKWAQDNEVDPELVEKDYVTIEGKQDVRTKQQILRELERESQKAERKTQRPSLEEAAIRKATEIAHKTKEEQYIYERTGKDAGLFAVSKKPPTKGAYKKITPPKAGELKGEVTEGYAGFTPEELKDVKKLRQKIHAIAINKGLTKKALSDLKLKHVGYRKLTGKVAGRKISLEQLQNLLKAVQKARPKQVGYKKVITRKTEKKIQSLKENLKKKLQMTDEAFNEILEKEVHGKQPKYTSAKDFITETQGKDIIRRMHDEAEVLKATLSFDRAIEKNPEIAEQVKKLQAELDQKKKRDPYRVESMRYYAQQSQQRTGAPIFTMYMDLLNTNLEIHKTRHARITALENQVPGFKKIAGDEAALNRVSQYIASQSTLKDKPLPPKNITKDEIQLAKEIQIIFKDYELKARVNKFFNWYYYGEDIAEFDRFKREIHKAEDIFESQGKEELIEYLKTQTWGVVKSGYEPLESVVMKIKPYKTGPKTVGKGHIKIRTDIEYHSQERNVLQRLNSYMKQMDMLYNLSPKINAFVRLYDDNMSKFANPRKVQESVESFLRNLKRYNVEGSWFGDIISRIYAQASQIIIMAQPVLAFRNLFQNPAFEHDKSALIDPRNESLTPSEIEYMETYIQQLRGMLEEFFMINERSLPGTKTLMRLIKKIKIYAWSDVKNRQWGFWAKINQVKRAQKADSISEMMEQAKFEDITELEQIRALGILARDGKEAMARYVARVHVDDIHFLYERAQRSPAEMDPLGRVFGNLMLFPRAYTEKLAHAVSKLTSPTSSYTERLRSAKILVSVIVGGILTGTIYTTITGRKRNPYNPLNLLGFRLGGLVLGLVEDVNNAYNLTLRALSGDKKALYALTTLLPQMADMFIPFYDWTLRGLEAGTQTKNLDRAALRKILELIDKEYEVREDAYKMERSLVESMQYIFAGKGVDYKVVEKKAPVRRRIKRSE